MFDSSKAVVKLLESGYLCLNRGEPQLHYQGLKVRGGKEICPLYECKHLS